MTVLDIVKVCDTVDLRLKGLQNEKIGQYECCLFIYEGETRPKFWGKNTLYVLYVTLVCGDVVVDCQKIPANSETPISLNSYGDLVIESRIKIPIGAVINIHGEQLEFE